MEIGNKIGIEIRPTKNQRRKVAPEPGAESEKKAGWHRNGERVWRRERTLEPGPAERAGAGAQRYGRSRLLCIIQLFSDGCGCGPPELDVMCDDLTDQRDRLQILVNGMKDCREHYEHSLLQTQSDQAELHGNRMQTDKL
ncbi:hypothetical protein EVAR_94474_1 [Eumeta japonica]|uniref:Uncharacterized protein n=1 Tax=Eumeta variegata TaxID=151549 RepID=A0A4C1UVY5_EUMVA|nr:hypothetical protein EVAR_94474_1 [Eumeta japonica]